MERLHLKPPFSIGPYRCEEVVGIGGWGTVYRAIGIDGTSVAVKVIDSHPDPDQIDRDRFDRVTARLKEVGRHPNLVEVLDAGNSRVAGGHDVLWIAMPYVDHAVTLRHRLEALGSPAGVGWTRKVVSALAAGLGVLHHNKIVHRDLKPENIMVLPNGTVVIIDFDIACLADEDRATSLGRHFGTLGYRAPEQLDGECGPASDLWALGVIAYEMYTCEHPFFRAGMRDEDLMRAIREEHPAPPSELRTGISLREDSLVLRMLDKVAWRRGMVTKGGSELKARGAWPRDQAPRVSVTAETRGDVDAAVSSALVGHAPDSVVVPATRKAALRAAREQLGGYPIKLAIEPTLAPFAYPGWEAKASLNELPYRPDPGEVYDKGLLADPARLREVARTAVEDAARSGVDRLCAPWTVANEAVDLQMLVSLRMLANTLHARDEMPGTGNLPVITTVALPVNVVTHIPSL